MSRIALLGLLLAPALAVAGPAQLTSSVTRAPLDPAVVVVPASSGKTVLERYRASIRPVSGTPLVVIVRLPDANSPDAFAVSDAHRDGNRIAVTLDTRRFLGPLAANDATMPLVEIALGDLAKGTYTIDIDEQIRNFTKLGAPDSATKPHRGLSSSITLTVQ
jgi:hypothetical protein